MHSIYKTKLHTKEIKIWTIVRKTLSSLVSWLKFPTILDKFLQLNWGFSFSLNVWMCPLYRLCTFPYFSVVRHKNNVLSWTWFNWSIVSTSYKVLWLQKHSYLQQKLGHGVEFSIQYLQRLTLIPYQLNTFWFVISKKYISNYNVQWRPFVEVDSFYKNQKRREYIWPFIENVIYVHY